MIISANGFTIRFFIEHKQFIVYNIYVIVWAFARKGNLPWKIKK